MAINAGLDASFNDICTEIIIFIIIYLNCKWVLPSGSDTAIRLIAQITHITENNRPYSDKTQHTNYKNNKGHTTHNEYNANTITNTIK
jgi:hypothetical protein